MISLHFPSDQNFVMSAAAATDSAVVLPVLPPIVFVHSDMPQDSRDKCVEFTLEALVKHKIEKDQAMHVKKNLEEWNGALWVVVIGVAYGASLAHENATLCMFRIGKVHVLCFQSYDEGALINSKKAAEPRAHKVVAKEDDAPAAAVEEAKAE